MNNSYLQTGTIVLSILYMYQSFSVTTLSTMSLNKLVSLPIRFLIIFIPLIIFEFFPDDIFIMLIIHLSYIPIMHFIKLVISKILKVNFKYLGYIKEYQMLLILAVMFIFSLYFKDYSLGGVMNLSLSTFEFAIIDDFNLSYFISVFTTNLYVYLMFLPVVVTLSIIPLLYLEYESLKLTFRVKDRVIFASMIYSINQKKEAISNQKLFTFSLGILLIALIPMAQMTELKNSFELNNTFNIWSGIVLSIFIPTLLNLFLNKDQELKTKLAISKVDLNILNIQKLMNENLSIQIKIDTFNKIDNLSNMDLENVKSQMAKLNELIDNRAILIAEIQNYIENNGGNIDELTKD